MTQRMALTLPPSYETLNDKRDAYLQPREIRKLAKQHGRYWAFHRIPTTVALPGNRFAKSLAGFTSHTNETDFRELIREFTEAGCPRPSGYADVFHEKFRSPRVNWSINALISGYTAGGWQQAITPGISKGRYYKYDLRSAYLWSASCGMPDTRSYSHSLKPGIKGLDGLYLVKLLELSPGAPFPFNTHYNCLATNQEIELYNLRIGEIVDGVVWQGTIDPTPIIRAVRQVSVWKEAARAFWGRWGQVAKLECVSRSNKWLLPNPALNIPWAHAITSRVRMRLWEASKDAIHVYVDSVITPHQLPTGTNVGDWRLEKVYDAGVFVRGPGQYGCLNADKLDRMAGVAKDSAGRYTSIALRDDAPITVLPEMNTMATERNAKTMAEFFKFRRIGQTVAGRVTEHKPGKPGMGEFIVMSPAIIAANGTMHRYKAVAIGLTTDLAAKISPSDKGQFLSLSFVDTEPTDKGSERKIFKVLVLTKDEMVMYAKTDGIVRVDDVYRKPDGEDGQPVPDDEDEAVEPF